MNDMNTIKLNAFMDEMEKLGNLGFFKSMSKMFGRSARKKSMAFARSNSLRTKAISKTKKRAKKPVSGKNLNFLQRGLGSILYRGRQAVKNPVRFLKDDWASSVKYMRRPMHKVKKGKYTTIFGNKRKVLGYSGGDALIEKRLPAKVLGSAMSVPGLAGLSYAVGPKKDAKGKKRSKAKRGAIALGEGVGWRVAPAPMMLGLVGKAVYDAKKQKRV